MSLLRTCYEILILTGGEGENRRITSHISPEGEDRLARLLEPHQISAVRFLYQTTSAYCQERIDPWAIVAFEKEYRLAGHIFSQRVNPKDPTFTNYTIHREGGCNPEEKPPDCSALSFNSKQSARELKKMSHLFQTCWSVLEGIPEGRNWLCFAPPLDEDWVQKTEKGDAALFYSLYVPDNHLIQDEEEV